MSERATELTAEEITELRQRARREAGPFVDPYLVHRIVIHNPEWASEILGRPFLGADRLPWSDLYLMHLASRAEPGPPPPPRETARRLVRKEEMRQAEEQRLRAREGEVREWEALAAALPVQVEVRHNYTSHRHLESYTQGGDHIYLLEELRIGRLHRRANHVLCWTPSRAKDLREFPEPATDGRVPSCKACLKTARSMAERK